jgi:hypothetical protein
MLYVDVPSEADIRALAAHRGEASVSIYLPTTPLSQQAAADRVEFGNLVKEALRQLRASGADKRQVAALEEQLEDLITDDEFWRFQARSLAVFATPENVRTFRVASELSKGLEVSDRFHLKPLLRVVSFCQSAYVLALSENAVRVIEVSADLPAETVAIRGMPKDAASAAGKASIKDRSPSGRLQGDEGQNVRLRQFARKVDAALRDLLAGSGVPLVLAAAPPISLLYPSVNSYTHLAAKTIEGNPETLSDADLAEGARAVLDELHAEEVRAWVALFDQRENQGRATTDVAQIARAATFGAVDSLLVDIDQSLPGTIDEATGVVTLADAAGAGSYGVIDEIARRVLDARGHVIGVRKGDVPRGAALAAILRYPV